MWRLAVELKPKWGFLPSSPFLQSHTAAIKRSVCRYCMHQHYKRSKQLSSAHSSTQANQSERCTQLHPLISSLTPTPFSVWLPLPVWCGAVCQSAVVSDFCPLDLYSGSCDRVRRAVSSLFPHTGITT